MKKVILMIVCLVCSIDSFTQNAQIKLYLQQIAANKAYIELLQKGYQIVKQGWKTIGDIKHAHFTLDGDFFKSLEAINPKVGGCAKTAGSIVLYQAINNDASMLINYVNGVYLFSDAEKKYVRNVVAHIQTDATGELQILEGLVTDSEFKMSDDDRIRRIDEIYSKLQEMFSFISHFFANVKVLALQKSRERNEVLEFRKNIEKK